MINTDFNYKNKSKNFIKTLHNIQKESKTNILADGAYIFSNENLELGMLPEVREKEKFTEKELCNYFILMHEKLRENIGAKAVKFRHPCIFNKKTIFVSGKLRVKNGKIIYINNYSGHYTPDIWDLYQSIKAYSMKYLEIFAPNFVIGYLYYGQKFKTRSNRRDIMGCIPV